MAGPFQYANYIGIDPGVKGSMSIISSSEGMLMFRTWDLSSVKSETKVIQNVRRGIESALIVFNEFNNHEYRNKSTLVVVELPALIHNPSTYGLQMAHIGALISRLSLISSFFFVGALTPSDHKRVVGYTTTVEYANEHGVTLPKTKWKAETVADSYCIAVAGRRMQIVDKLRMV